MDVLWEKAMVALEDDAEPEVEDVDQIEWARSLSAWLLDILDEYEDGSVYEGEWDPNTNLPHGKY